MHWGVERREAWRQEENRAEEARLIWGEAGEARQNTLQFKTSRRRWWWQRKSAQKMGRDTWANKKGQSNLWEPKCRGMILEPENMREEPSAVTNLTQKGRQKEELEKLKWRHRSQPGIFKRREGPGDRWEKNQKNWQEASSYRPAIFPTRSRELNISEPDHHGITEGAAGAWQELGPGVEEQGAWGAAWGWTGMNGKLLP